MGQKFLQKTKWKKSKIKRHEYCHQLHFTRFRDGMTENEVNGKMWRRPETNLLWGPKTEKTHKVKMLKLEITMYGLWSCIILWLYSNTIIKERVCRGKKVNLEFLLSLKICLSELSHTESLLVITVNIIQENSSIGCLWPKDKDWKSTQNKLKIHLTLYLNADYSSQWDRTHFDVSQSTAFSSILLKWQTDENQLTSFDFSTPASISSSFWITEIIPLGTLIALSHNH